MANVYDAKIVIAGNVCEVTTYKEPILTDFKKFIIATKILQRLSNKNTGIDTRHSNKYLNAFTIYSKKLIISLSPSLIIIQGKYYILLLQIFLLLLQLG